MSGIVKLNIGGFKFCSTTATLTKYPNTFFSGMLCGQLSTTKDEEGAFFIDRDGQFFSPILTWLRTSEISIPNTMTKEDVVREAKFFCLLPLVEELTYVEKEEEIILPLNVPCDIERYVNEYFERHASVIMEILKRMNKEGNMNVSVQIIPGHRQDFERPPQLLENGKLGLYMNFTALHISKYSHVQALLGKCFKLRGFSGYFRPGYLMELWWAGKDIHRENDIVYF